MNATFFFGFPPWSLVANIQDSYLAFKFFQSSFFNPFWTENRAEKKKL